jgi:hypothetical protein
MRNGEQYTKRNHATIIHKVPLFARFHFRARTEFVDGG